MNITINDRQCGANTGDRLLDVARAGHSHIGYFCGGNALCQTCYVKVLEGGELLSPMTNAEKAMLSDALIREGARMACQATIEKAGKLTVLTTVEEARRMTLTNPAAIPAYMGKMGWEAAEKFTDTIAFQAQRDLEGYQVSAWQLLTDVVDAIGDAIQLVFDAVRSVFTPVTETGNACCPPAGNGAAPKTESCCPTQSVLKFSPEALRMHTGDAVACN
ncbi:MAG: (2Fe-2S)-binding protein [Chlorobiaceae bacterium]|nr:(2Fe-2S)-binding protein [Chlorobiaceae bacterium]